MNNEEKILVNVTPNETRVAWVENGVLQEVWVERSNKRGLVGNIYIGKVERVLPGMQAAFVNIGLERAAFLHVSDVCHHAIGYPDTECDDIVKLLHPGQKIMVQVVKDPLGSKGARITMQVTIPSRMLVYMPIEKTLGVSQKIDSQEERERLREMVKQIPEYQGSEGGYIVRTVAEGVDFHEMRADMLYLQRLWNSIQDKARQARKPAVVYEDLPLYLRIMRDIPIDRIEKIRVDSTETLKKMQSFVDMYVMELADRVGLYQGERPIFDLYNIEEELQAALHKRVNLKSGGYLIIDQTEAMTTIDVNTGAFVGHRNLEETIYRTNLEATQAIARQLRLRNLGGIIILDFIDMEDSNHQQHVLGSLEKELSKDRVKTTISSISSLGLVEMTRKRTRESLERTLCEPCPVCSGRGTVKTAETVAYEIFREITRMARSFDAQTYRVIAAESVVSRIMDEESSSVAELEAFLNKSIRFQAESTYAAEQFDVVMM
ncbi:MULTISPECIES: ribonuclease G [Thiomicrorhabdus]|uniref:Ribonuclease G n=1 Tax=Thiomicrorhabdus heinhorstiae TaxID=2748010 RepID=A0ABS0BXW0_9GAMM|nr:MULTISPECIES: ribonuclease G [Thiomicrorhabdus]MBF6058632.1 ribonuclease G [Thiomicrorhabdus heinhorstiae]